MSVRASAGGGREGPPGPVGAAGALAAAVTKAISAKGRRPVAVNTLLYDWPAITLVSCLYGNLESICNF